MKPSIHFLLLEILPGAPLQVAGRNCGADLPLGTVFTAIHRRDYPPHAPGEEIAFAEPVFVTAVDLRLEAIEMWRRAMDLVDHGHTALLTLSGSGADEIAALLASRCPLTQFSLVAPGAVPL